MLRPQEALLETTAQKIARILTRQYGINVRVEGSRAYIDMETMTVVIPNLTGKEAEDLGDVLDGFLDHECAHVMFTDPIAMRTIKSDRNLHNVWNAVEDWWIERTLGEQYLGCRQNIHRLNEALSQKLRAKWGEVDMLNRLLFAFQECWRGAAQPGEFDADDQIGALWSGLRDELNQGYTVKSTAGALELSRRIIARIQDMAEPSPPPENQPQPQQDQGDSQDQPQPQQGDGDQAEGDPESGDQESGQDGGQDQDGQGESEGDQESGDGDQDGDQGGDQADGDQAGDQGNQDGSQAGQDGPQDDSRDSEGQGSSDGSETSQRAQEQAKQFKDKMDGHEFADPMDAEAMVNEMIGGKDEAEQDQSFDPMRRSGADPDEYLVFSEEFDTEVEYGVDERIAHAKTYSRLKDEVQEYIGTMATHLELSLAAETESRRVGGARRGRKWDKRRMPQWFLGGDDDRVWTQLEEGVKHDTAVTLLFDCSGSMGRSGREGTKASLARLAAVAFHEALLRAGITHEVLGFNTGGPDIDELEVRARAAMDRGEDLGRFSRIEETDNRFVFVPFGQADGRAVCEITGGAANRDGESVLWAARRLAGSPEKRKILIVVSDGQPSGARYGTTERNYLRQVVEQVIVAGLEVYGIGVMSKAVKKYYPQWVVINQASDLPRVVMEQLARSLLTKQGTEHGHLSEVHKESRSGS